MGYALTAQLWSDLQLFLPRRRGYSAGVRWLASGGSTHPRHGGLPYRTPTAVHQPHLNYGIHQTRYQGANKIEELTTETTFHHSSCGDWMRDSNKTIRIRCRNPFFPIGVGPTLAVVRHCGQTRYSLASGQFAAVSRVSQTWHIIRMGWHTWAEKCWRSVWTIEHQRFAPSNPMPRWSNLRIFWAWQTGWCSVYEP